MSWPVWRVEPDNAALITEAQLICAAVATIVGLPALAFACVATFKILFHVSLALDGPFPVISQICVLLVFSIVGSWFFFIVAIPIVSAGLRTGKIGFAPTAIAGAVIGFSVTFLIVLLLPLTFGQRFGMALFTGCFGIGFSLVFWMLVRLINPRAFDNASRPGNRQGIVQ